MITPYLQLSIAPSIDPVLQGNLQLIDAAFGATITTHTAQLSGGTVTVSNATVATTALSRIVFGVTTTAGTPGTVTCVLTPTTSIVFNSTSATDTSTVTYQVVNSPAAFMLSMEPAFVADPSQDTQTVPAQIKNY